MGRAQKLALTEKSPSLVLSLWNYRACVRGGMGINPPRKFGDQNKNSSLTRKNSTYFCRICNYFQLSPRNKIPNAGPELGQNDSVILH